MHLEQNSVWSVLELDGVIAGEYRLLYLSKVAKIVIIYPLVNKDSIRKPVLVGLEEFDAAVKSEALKISELHLPNYQLVSDEERNFSITRGRTSI